jgi:hypothetical protein
LQGAGQDHTFVLEDERVMEVDETLDFVANSLLLAGKEVMYEWVSADGVQATTRLSRAWGTPNSATARPPFTDPSYKPRFWRLHHIVHPAMPAITSLASPCLPTTLAKDARKGEDILKNRVESITELLLRGLGRNVLPKQSCEQACNCVQGCNLALNCK